MTNKEKKLLIQDLCARLPYKVKCAGWLNINNDKDVDKVYPWIDGEYIDGITYNKIRIQGTWVETEFVRPYLRQMSNMTKEECKKFDKFCVIDEDAWKGNMVKGHINQSKIMSDGIDYLNSIHVDFRGLIPMGLAIEVTEENNPYK